MFYLIQWENKDGEKSNTAVMLYGKCTQSTCDLTQLTQPSFKWSVEHMTSACKVAHGNRAQFICDLAPLIQPLFSCPLQ